MTVCPRCATENPDAAKFCNECGAPLAIAVPREQRKTVTVLFCDVSGSTALGERTDPEAMRSLMARYFDVARTAIERHGGTVEKFIGDAVMSIFGVPTVHEDDALRAVRAAIELRDTVEVDVRIGVNTGEVVTGGADTLATGDAVNVAARLEQAAGTGEVLLGAETYALVRDAVDAELLPPLEAKGKSQPLTAYRLRAVTGELRRRDSAPMVGRGREREVLAQAYGRAVHEQACHLFTILGTAGIGKSRLVTEFLAGLDEARVVVGRCLSYGEGITYWPVVEALKQLDVAVESVLPEGTTPPEIAWAVRKALEQAALERPLVVVFDDIQWGEPTFLDLIEHVADLSRGAPILLLCMARPELLDVRPGWAGGKLNATSVLLEPLARDDTDTLVHELFADADTELVARIRDAAEGNPLFVEEMVELARTSGGAVVVPPTIQALLTARLDSLPLEERAVLERGAVEGQVFHRNAVAALAPDEAHVDTRLSSLVRKELVRPDRALLVADDAYRFRHLLIRDAAYDALPKSMRIELHERFATWLEEHGADLVELDEVVGYHLEQAARYAAELGTPDPARATRAAERLAAAARRADARGDVPAIVNLAERAQALFARDDPRRLALLPMLGSALRDHGRLEESGRAFDEAVAEGGAVVRAHASALRARLRSPSTGNTAALAEIVAAIAELEHLGDDLALADAFAALANVFFWSGRIADMREAGFRALEHARRTGDVRAEAITAGIVARALEWSETPRSEVEAAARELLEDERFGLRIHVGGLNLLGRCAFARGDFEAAAALFAEAQQRMLELGSAVESAGQYQFAAVMEWTRRDWVQMEEAGRRSWDALGELGETGYRSTAGAMLAIALAWLGRDAEARAVVAEAEAMAAADDYVTKLWALAARSRLAVTVRDFSAAVELARGAYLQTLESDDAIHHYHALVVLAEALAAAGDQEASVRAGEAAALAERMGAAGYAARARSVLEHVE